MKFDFIVKVGRLFFLGMTSGLLILTFLIGAQVLYKHSQASVVRVVKPTVTTDVVIAAEGSGEESDQISLMVATDDARPLLIKRYLEKYKSPLVPYSDLIFKLSQTYGFDYYWILAIGQQESNLCKKIPENSFNCWGYGIHKNGTLRFENYELALKSYAEYLKREYFDKGLNTPELIMKKYCPHSNGSWAYGVQHFIDEIETGRF